MIFPKVEKINTFIGVYKQFFYIMAKDRIKNYNGEEKISWCTKRLQ